MNQSFRILRPAYRKLLDYVSSLYPEEACGFLAGWGDVIEIIIPVSNLLHQTTRFKMDPQEQINAMQWIEKERLTWLGIFHSHPDGEAYPSESDKKEYAYPEIPSFICAPVKNDWTVRAFWIIDDLISEKIVEVL